MSISSEYISNVDSSQDRKNIILFNPKKGMGYTIRNDETGAFGAYDPEGQLVRPFKGGTRRRQRRRRGQKSRR